MYIRSWGLLERGGHICPPSISTSGGGGGPPRAWTRAIGGRRELARVPLFSKETQRRNKSTQGARRPLQVTNLTFRTPPAFATDWLLGLPPTYQFKRKYYTDWEGSIIGKGQYGVVRKTIDIYTGKEYAVKTLTKYQSRAKLQNETTLILELGTSLDICYCYGIWEDDAEVHILQELCKGGDILHGTARRTGHSYSEDEVVRIITSVLRVTAQCHARNFIHRDIKPENFMFLDDSENSPIRAIDFGLSTAIKPGETLSDRCGTVHYCAPEVILREYGKEADLWSVGVLTYQLLTGGSLPFSDMADRTESMEQRFESILHNDLKFEGEIWDNRSLEAKAFVQALLTRDKRERMTALEALDHSWVRRESFITGETSNPMEMTGTKVQRLQRFGTYSKLKQLVLQNIAQMLMDEEERSDLQGLREMFEFLDHNNTGAIFPEAIHAALSQEGYQLSKDEFDQLTNSMECLCMIEGPGKQEDVRALEPWEEKNNSDCENFAIELSEFVAALLDWDQFKVEGGWAALAEQSFHNWTQGGKYLDLSDIERLGDTLNGLNRKLVTNSLKNADTNGDKRVSLSDFLVEVGPQPHLEKLDIFDSRFYPHKRNLVIEDADETPEGAGTVPEQKSEVETSDIFEQNSDTEKRVQTH
mmetsp:Transcript_17736/g.29812  ORF Transcript_17736/g.29812 Transcript_17736/m.29812 type:complete len:644 (-) Transcript_17736:30-1961(-)